MRLHPFRRLIKDFKQRELLPLKLLYFFKAASFVVLYPYITIHMRALGITPEETGISSTFIPIVAILGPPIAGIIADRIGNFKILLTIMTAIIAGVAALLLLIPFAREMKSFPSNKTMWLGCHPHSTYDGFILSSYDPYPCHLHETFNKTKAVVQSCGFVCSSELLPSIETVNGVSYNVRKMEDNNTAYQIIGPSEGDNKAPPVEIYSDDESFVYFPVRPYLEMHCLENDTASAEANSSLESCGLSRKSNPEGSWWNNTQNNAELEMTINPFPSSNGTRFLLLSFSTKFGQNHTNVKCANELPSVTASIMLENSSQNLGLCFPQCLILAPRQSMCSNKGHEVVHDVALTFWMYTLLRVIVGFLSATSFVMFEGAVVSILREQNADYGLQRIYSSIASMVFSPLSGALIDYASDGKDYTDFRPAFFLYAALNTVASFITLTMNLDFKQPERNVLKNLKVVLSNVEIVVFLVAIFCTGMTWGYIETFLFWFLEDLGASKLLMGLTLTVGAGTGIPLLYLAGPIIARVGHVNVLCMGLLFFTVRLTGYSFITTPLMCLPFEAMEAVTAALALTAATTYAATLSTPGTTASVQGIMGGMYYGVGRGAGSLLGGYLIKFVGPRGTYRIFAIIAFIVSVMYFSFNMCYLRKKKRSAAQAESTLPAEGEKGNDVKKDPELNNVLADIILTSKAAERNFSVQVDGGLRRNDDEFKSNDKSIRRRHSVHVYCSVQDYTTNVNDFSRYENTSTAEGGGEASHTKHETSQL